MVFGHFEFKYSAILFCIKCDKIDYILLFVIFIVQVLRMAEQETVTVTISPSRVTRVQEKEQLAGLNDRLIQYIEKVRSLKEKNLHLEVELTTTKEQLGRESESIKLLYEGELKDARALVDETAKEKARQQILASKNSVRVAELEDE